MRYLWHIPALILMSGLWLASGSALSADSDQEQARRLQQAGKILPLGKILERARTVHPGRIIEVELEQKGGRYIYEIESVDREGHVREMQFDARSGALLTSENKKDD